VDQALASCCWESDPVWSSPMSMGKVGQGQAQRLRLFGTNFTAPFSLRFEIQSLDSRATAKQVACT
jgi:hypothetical protein